MISKLSVVYVLFAFSAFFLILSFSLFFYYSKNIDVKEVYADVNITSDSGGFDLNNSALTFGKVTLGGSSTRSLKIFNDYEFPISVVVSKEGNISPYLFLEKKIRIQPNETRIYGISVIAPSDAKLGFYSGKIIFKTRKALY